MKPFRDHLHWKFLGKIKKTLTPKVTNLWEKILLKLQFLYYRYINNIPRVNFFAHDRCKKFIYKKCKLSIKKNNLQKWTLAIEVPNMCFLIFMDEV